MRNAQDIVGPFYSRCLTVTPGTAIRALSATA